MCNPFCVEFVNGEFKIITKYTIKSYIWINGSWIIALMMEAVSVSETSVSFYQTAWRNIQEDGYNEF
jgi:hypothetical protein